jgi:hypothetical protein
MKQPVIVQDYFVPRGNEYGDCKICYTEIPKDGWSRHLSLVHFDRFPQHETVNHPQHYGGSDNPYEAIKVIEAWKLGFNLGNTVKYILRAPHKNSLLEDLKKARWYLDREIENQEKPNG